MIASDRSKNSLFQPLRSGAANNGLIVSPLLTLLLAALPVGAARADTIYVSNFIGPSGTIGKYTTAGATVNASLISTFNTIEGIAVSGSDLFVANFADGTIGEYTTSGTTVNAALVTGLGDIGPTFLAVTASAPIPEPSTWAMMLIGFASLGLAGYRCARAGHAKLAA
jgi:hypothetical protein